MRFGGNPTFISGLCIWVLLAQTPNSGRAQPPEYVPRLATGNEEKDRVYRLVTLPRPPSDMGDEPEPQWVVPAPGMPESATDQDGDHAPMEQELTWWTVYVGQPLRGAEGSIPADVVGLMSLAAKYSGRVLAVRHEPWLQASLLRQATAAFDPAIYGNNLINSSSDPVGNSLITGGPPRLQEYNWRSSAGLRGQTNSGATYDLSQRLGHLNSNSTFVLPNNQGTSRLAASISQPLLRNRSLDLNRSLVLSTRHEAGAAQALYLDTLQQQLNDVASVYWSLYTERAIYVLRVQHLRRAEEITRELEDRASFDAVRSQVLRAQAAVAVRTAELVRSDANIKNLESRLRALLNAPGISDQSQLEIVTDQPAWVENLQFDMELEIEEALARRPEVQRIASKIQAAEVRVRLAADQTKPQLDMVLEGYVAGLRGSSDVFGAIGDQFSDGRPGYAGGFELEMPYRNRSAIARLTQRKLEVEQLQNELREVRDTVRAEVESAVRNIEASYQATISRQLSLQAVISEVDYLEDRWRALRGDNQLGQLQLDDLLNAQVRLFQEEQSLLTSMVDFNRALIEVQRATGTLVRFSQ